MQFIIDTEGKRTGAIISMDELEGFISAKEELEDTKDFDAIMAADEWVDSQEAKKEIGL